MGILPTVEGSPVVVVDVGANVDCSPRMLAQFAVMGEIYSRIILRRPKPRVGLLSIGEEEHKGNELTRAARAAAARRSTSTSSATWKAAISTAATWT